MKIFEIVYCQTKKTVNIKNLFWIIYCTGQATKKINVTASVFFSLISDWISFKHNKQIKNILSVQSK